MLYTNRKLLNVLFVQLLCVNRKVRTLFYQYNYFHNKPKQISKILQILINYNWKSYHKLPSQFPATSRLRIKRAQSISVYGRIVGTKCMYSSTMTFLYKSSNYCRYKYWKKNLSDYVIIIDGIDSIHATKHPVFKSRLSVITSQAAWRR